MMSNEDKESEARHDNKDENRPKYGLKTTSKVCVKILLLTLSRVNPEVTFDPSESAFTATGGRSNTCKNCLSTGGHKETSMWVEYQHLTDILQN